MGDWGSSCFLFGKEKKFGRHNMAENMINIDENKSLLLTAKNKTMKDKLFELYERIEIGKNSICQSCRKNKNFEIPLSFYHIGENFNDDKDNVAFVGKTAVGGANFEAEYRLEVKSGLYTDATKFGIESLRLNEQWAFSRPFYNYTHEIIKSYFGNIESGLKKSALTNLIKCNNASTNDVTPNDVKHNCLNEVAVVWQEIELINASRVIFYTHNSYDSYILNFTPKNTVSIEDIFDAKHRVKIGQKDMPWWHRKFTLEDGSQKHFLRIGHPQMKKKSAFIDSVTNWLKETKQ